MPFRSAKPDLSVPAQKAYKEYELYLTNELDLRPPTVRNYLSDAQQFMTWFEKQHHQHFTLDIVATPTLTTYRDYLQQDLQQKTLSKLQHEIIPEASDVVFVSVRTKGILTTYAIGLIKQKYTERAGLDIHFHDSRHRFEYRMAAKSTPLHRLAQIMGHDSLNTIMVYVQATQHDLQQEVEDIAWR